jgi:hypothetical protein
MTCALLAVAALLLLASPASAQTMVGFYNNNRCVFPATAAGGASKIFDHAPPALFYLHLAVAFAHLLLTSHAHRYEYFAIPLTWVEADQFASE